MKELDEYGCPIPSWRYCCRPDPYIIRGYPKKGYGWSQGVTWAIFEREDGHYVECHWRSMWHGGEESHGCFATDAAAEKWIRKHVKFEEDERIRKERKADLKKAKELREKWK